MNDVGDPSPYEEDGYEAYDSDEVHSASVTACQLPFMVVLLCQLGPASGTVAESVWRRCWGWRQDQQKLNIEERNKRTSLKAATARIPNKMNVR